MQSLSEKYGTDQLVEGRSAFTENQLSPNDRNPVKKSNDTEALKSDHAAYESEFDIECLKGERVDPHYRIY